MSKIFLIAGLGADTRLYNNIDLHEHEVVPVDWIESDELDTLTSYAEKLIYQYHITPNSIVIGTSLGGMIAIEIAKKISLKKVILISSIKTTTEAPRYFSWFRKIPVYKIIPDGLLTSFNILIELIIGKINIEDIWLFKDMLKRSSPKFLKWAMGAALNWKNEYIPPNVYHLIGDKDRVFPYKAIKNATIIKGETHMMIFNKAKQINKLLKAILKKEMKLPQSLYLRNDVVNISKELLGKYLFTCINGETTGGYIVETEAYNGIIDKASHAYGNRKTPRTQIMFEQGGTAYVYLCYGIHEMFNVVTSAEGQPHAILIRAIQPVEGLEIMQLRRNMPVLKPTITSGPGSVAKALAISRKINGISLQSDILWIEDRGLSFPEKIIAAVPRIGVAYAGQDALLPYRFYVKENPYVSKPNK